MFWSNSNTIQKFLTTTVLILTLLIISPDGAITPTNGRSENQVLAQGARPGPGIMEDVSTPIQAMLTIDDYPPVGQPATLTCEISSVLDAPNTTAQIELPANSRLVSGDLNWQGDLLAGTPIIFTATVVFDAPGDAAVFCRARRVIDAENSWGDLAELYLSISQKDSKDGFAPVAPENRYQLGELIESGDGQIIDEAKEQSAPPSQGQAVEPPPSVDPSAANETHVTSTEITVQGDLTVTGRWGYYDRDDNYIPALEFIIELVRGDNGNHLAWCYTSPDGYYSCGPVTNPGSVGVRTVMYSYIKYNPYDDVLAVVNPDWGTSNNVYNTFGTQTGVHVFSDGTHDIGSWVSTNGSTYERAYWIQRDLNDTWRYIWFGTGSSQSPQETAGAGTVEWKIDSTDGTYYSRGGNIHLAGVDPLSNTVVSHEYGHNIMYNVYGNWMPTTYCPNPHYVQLSSHVNCAWTEGWANFLPLAVNNDPVYRWADGSSLNLENPTWGSFTWDEGDDVEGRVAGALWDILDTSNENDDQYSDGGIINIWDTLYHQNDNNFSQYWSAWKSRGHNNTSAGPVMSIFQNTIDYRNGPANDDFDNRTTIWSLPFIITNFNTANATTQGNDPHTPCGSTSTPKQSRSVWYRYTPATTGNYIITTDGSNYDTVLAVWTGTFGSLTNQGCDDNSGMGSQSSLALTLNGGTTYYIEVMRYGSGSGGLLNLFVTLNEQPSINLAVTPPGFDDIGTVLSRPELGYPWMEIQVADLANYSLLSQYDAIFINCSWNIQSTPQVASALQQYVQNGGSIYASDWAYEYIRDAFPGYINFPTDPYIGMSQQVTANITDAGLTNYINPTNPPSTIDLEYDLGGWVVIDSVGADTTVHVRGTFDIYSSLSSLALTSFEERQQLQTQQAVEALDQLTNKPLVVSFEPYGANGGKVIFTTFHNEAQQTDLEKKLLEYLVLVPLTSAQQQAVAQVIAAEGLDLMRIDINTIDPGANSSSIIYAYTQEGVTDPRLVFALAWSGSSLGLSVYRPDGSLYQQLQSSQSPIKVVIPNAESGNWKYQVTGVNVPYNNYPYVVGIGAEKVEQVYLPIVIK